MISLKSLLEKLETFISTRLPFVKKILTFINDEIIGPLKKIQGWMFSFTKYFMPVISPILHFFFRNFQTTLISAIIGTLSGWITGNAVVNPKVKEIKEEQKKIEENIKSQENKINEQKKSNEKIQKSITEQQEKINRTHAVIGSTLMQSSTRSPTTPPVEKHHK